MNTNNNPFGPYFAGAFRAALASCFIGGKISEHQIDFVKEAISRFREAEIDQSAFPNSTKKEIKSQWDHFTKSPRIWLTADCGFLRLLNEPYLHHPTAKIEHYKHPKFHNSSHYILLS